MKKYLLATSISLLLAGTVMAEPSAINSGNVQQTQQINESQNNVGNKSDWSQSIKDSNNGNESYWRQENTVKDSYNQINNSHQSIDNSYTKQEGIIGDGNKITSGTHSGSGDIKTSANGGESESESYSEAEGGAAKAESSSEGGEAKAYTGPITVNNGVGGGQQQQQSTTTIRHQGLVQAPSLAALVGFVSQNDDMCRYSNGGSASGSNGMGGGGLSLLFGFSDGHCEMLKQVKFLMAANDFYGACELILVYDQKEKDGYFATAMNKTGGCIRFRPVAAPAVYVPSPTALNTQEKLKSLKSPNALIDQQFHQGMIK